MNTKHDRQGVRTPADLEVKYDFTQSFNALEKRQRDNEVAQTQFENETEETLASLKESAATTNAALSNFNTRLTKTEKNALRLELAIKNMGGKPSNDIPSYDTQELEEINEKIEGLDERVTQLEQGGSGSSGFITSSHDGNGNVVIGGVSVSHDGNGNVVFR